MGYPAHIYVCTGRRALSCMRGNKPRSTHIWGAWPIIVYEVPNPGELQMKVPG